MKYMGSKNRIAKFILPIMMKEANEKGITTWVEPFVGGGNMIDKVPHDFKRIGIDCNVHTVLALEAIRDMVNELPKKVTVEYYNSLKGTKPKPITSLIRFGASFGGKFESGYARRNGKSMWGECVRNSKKQSPKLQGVELYCGCYQEYTDFENCLIYCDPPYEGTTSYKTGVFNSYEFWEYVRFMSENNLVFVSEYKAPDDFICVWEGEVKTNFASQRDKATHKAVEKLFKFSPTNAQ